jgi:hypothetical protein
MRRTILPAVLRIGVRMSTVGRTKPWSLGRSSFTRTRFADAPGPLFAGAGFVATSVFATSVFASAPPPSSSSSVASPVVSSSSSSFLFFFFFFAAAAASAAAAGVAPVSTSRRAWSMHTSERRVELKGVRWS